MTRTSPIWLDVLCAYMERHVAEDLSLDDLAVESGVTARALQYAFKQHLNTTPMRYLRQQKLKRVNETLKQTAKVGDATVTQAALASGFTNLGIFAQYYRQEFGELPSVTRKG